MDTFTHSTGDGAEHRFAHLTLYDVFGDPKKSEVNGFVPLYRKRLKAEALENMRVAGLDKFEITTELNGFDKHHKSRDPMEAFVEFLREAPEAAAEVVRHAYATANSGATLPETAGPIVGDVCWRLLEPFGITPNPDKPANPTDKSATYGDGGTDDPNPKPPLTYSTTVGGESTGPRSASA